MKRTFALLLLLIAFSWSVPDCFAQRKGSQRNGHYVVKNGKRIWVPQGSPAKSRKPSTRGVYEREQDAEIKNKTPINKPTP
jgi:hypothetical protein